MLWHLVGYVVPDAPRPLRCWSDKDGHHLDMSLHRWISPKTGAIGERICFGISLAR